MQFSDGALGGAGHGDEGAYLEAALPCVPPGFGVRVSGQAHFIVGQPAVQEVTVPSLVDLAGVRRGRPVGDAAGAHHGDAFRRGVAGLAQRSAELVGSWQGRQRRPLAVDVDWNHRQIGLRQQEVQRHHDAVVELPLLRVSEVDAGHDALDQAAGQGRRPRIGAWRDGEPLRVLDGALVALRHAHAVGRHVVHEEVGEVLGGDDHQRIRAGGANLPA